MVARISSFLRTAAFVIVPGKTFECLLHEVRCETAHAVADGGGQAWRSC